MKFLCALNIKLSMNRINLILETHRRPTRLHMHTHSTHACITHRHRKHTHTQPILPRIHTAHTQYAHSIHAHSTRTAHTLPRLRRIAIITRFLPFYNSVKCTITSVSKIFFFFLYIWNFEIFNKLENRFYNFLYTEKNKDPIKYTIFRFHQTLNFSSHFRVSCFYIVFLYTVYFHVFTSYYMLSRFTSCSWLC